MKASVSCRARCFHTCFEPELDCSSFSKLQCLFYQSNNCLHLITGNNHVGKGGKKHRVSHFTSVFSFVFYFGFVSKASMHNITCVLQYFFDIVNRTKIIGICFTRKYSISVCMFSISSLFMCCLPFLCDFFVKCKKKFWVTLFSELTLHLSISATEVLHMF